ncbi:unnamed protein product [Peronospora destructor]|uniref:Uncharacterized protein n=1 Tax=Peronospora destructor TaxID=86335 RepID=A0AAV0TSF2_9STRA|nr:unnamed protein product [Peronospora destructor]
MQTSTPKPTESSLLKRAESSSFKETKTSPKTLPKKPMETENEVLMVSAFTSVSVEAGDVDNDNIGNDDTSIKDDKDNENDGDDDEGDKDGKAMDKPKDPKPKKNISSKKSKKKRKVRCYCQLLNVFSKSELRLLTSWFKYTFPACRKERNRRHRYFSYQAVNNALRHSLLATQTLGGN